MNRRLESPTALDTDSRDGTPPALHKTCPHNA